jgi:hypothetical protein
MLAALGAFDHIAGRGVGRHNAVGAQTLERLIKEEA